MISPSRMASSTSSTPATRSASSSKRVIDIAVARDQAIAALLEIAEGAEAVVLELEQPVGVVERLFSPGRRDRLHARKGHDPHMGSLTFPASSAEKAGAYLSPYGRQR